VIDEVFLPTEEVYLGLEYLDLCLEVVVLNQKRDTFLWR